MQMNRLAFIHAISKHITLQHLLDGKMRSEINDIGKIHLSQPIRVVANFNGIGRIFKINEGRELQHIILHVALHILISQLRARRHLIGRIADLCRETPDEHDDAMSKLL